MVPTCSNSREYESSRARLMAHRVGDLANSGARGVSQKTGRVDRVEVSLIAGSGHCSRCRAGAPRASTAQIRRRTAHAASSAMGVSHAAITARSGC